MKTIPGNNAFLLAWIFSTIGCLVSPCSFCAAQHNIFDKSVIQKWKDYEAFSRNIQGKTLWTSTRLGGTARTTEHRYKQNRECTLFIDPGREPGTEVCSLSNPLYSAVIKRNSSDPSSAVLDKLDVRSTETDPHTAKDSIYCSTSPHFCYAHSRLSQLVLSPYFKVIKVTTDTHNNQELTRVDYNYTYDVPGSNRNRQERMNGSVFFDPSRCWCIRRYRDTREGIFRGEHLVDLEYEVEYETSDHLSGFPIIKSQTQHLIQIDCKTKRKNDVTSKCDYDLEIKEGPPNEEFTLSAFGLPEPGGADPVVKTTPMYIWILVSAGACGVIAFAFRILARRRNTTATS